MKTKVKRKRNASKEPFLHHDVQFKFAMFLQEFPPREFNRQLRNMFIEFARGHSYGGGEQDMKKLYWTACGT